MSKWTYHGLIGLAVILVACGGGVAGGGNTEASDDAISLLGCNHSDTGRKSQYTDQKGRERPCCDVLAACPVGESPIVVTGLPICGVVEDADSIQSASLDQTSRASPCTVYYCCAAPAKAPTKTLP
jgi:hypothetical protein